MSLVTWDDGKPHWKPKRGEAILARKAEDAKREKELREFATGVKARDLRCWWPEQHQCLGGPLEAAHIVDKSLCGPNTLENGITLCPFLHRRGPESIHGKQLKVERETPDGEPPLFSFWRQSDEVDALGQPIYYLVARERAPFIYERD